MIPSPRQKSPYICAPTFCFSYPQLDHHLYAFFLFMFRFICCSSSIVEYLGEAKRYLISEVYSITIAILIRFLSEISPFCSKRAILLMATPRLLCDVFSCEILFDTTSSEVIGNLHRYLIRIIMKIVLQYR